MDTRLQITVTPTETGFYVEAEIILGPTNRDIFYFENNGSSTLGPYIGVVNLDQLIQYQLWAGDPIPTFGVRYVRHNKAFDTLPDMYSVNQWKEIVRQDVQAFIREVSSATPEVTTYDMRP